MVDQLRRLWNRPLADRDRPRLFALAVAVIVAGAGLLALLGPEPPRRPRSSTSANVTPVPTAARPVPAPSTSPDERIAGEEDQPSAPLEVSRAVVKAAKHAADGFLAAYLPYTYGRAPATRIPFATPALRRQLRESPPRVSPRERRRRARLLVLQSDSVTHDRAEVTALADDGTRRYSLRLELTNTRAGWTVTRVRH